MSNKDDNSHDLYSKWFDAITKRRSRRHYDANQSIAPETINDLSLFCERFQPYSFGRSALITESADRVFKGILGSYGKVKNAPAVIAFTGDMSHPNVQEAVGYTGEGIILEATTLGLSTCWIGGFFNSNIVNSLIQLKPNERVLAVSPVGYTHNLTTFEEKSMTGFGITHRRKSLNDLVSGLSQAEWPDWIKPCLEAARQAPSAVNRQPWGFQVERDAITVLVRTSGIETQISKRLDCGIAMMHIDVALHYQGINGTWELLEPPQVARFRIAK